MKKEHFKSQVRLKSQFVSSPSQVRLKVVSRGAGEKRFVSRAVRKRPPSSLKSVSRLSQASRSSQVSVRLRCQFKNNNNKITGNSKHNPNANINFIINERYSDILGSNSIGNDPSMLFI